MACITCATCAFTVAAIYHIYCALLYLDECVEEAVRLSGQALQYVSNFIENTNSNNNDMLPPTPKLPDYSTLSIYIHGTPVRYWETEIQ